VNSFGAIRHTPSAHLQNHPHGRLAVGDLELTLLIGHSQNIDPVDRAEPGADLAACAPIGDSLLLHYGIP
jgi:hypothetical protein